MAVLFAGVCAAQAAEWRLTPSVAVSETFTDNDDLAPNGQKEAALITQVTPAIELRGTGPRLTLALDAAADLRYQTLNDPGPGADVDLAGIANAEIVPELFFLDLNASISQEVLNRRAASSASRTNNKNLSTVQTYRASPYLQHRLGGFADAEERVSVTRTIDNGDNFSDSTTYQLDLTLDSGDQFSKLLWDVDALASLSQESDDEDENEQRADLNLEYVVDNTFSLLGSGGYERLDFGNNGETIQQPTWRAGLRWQPFSRLELEGTYGKRFGGSVVDAKVDYQIGSETTISGQINTSLDEPQDRLNRDASSIGVDADGNIIDGRSNQPFDSATNLSSFNDERNRTTAYTVQLDSVRGRNTFHFVFRKEKQEGLFSGVEDDTMLFSGRWLRQLNSRTSVTGFASYENLQFGADDREDHEYVAIADLSYTVGPNTQLSLTYSFQLKDSTDSTSEFTENTVTLAATFSF